MNKKEELSPILQRILDMPKTGRLPGRDINGDEARVECYKEKYGLILYQS